MCLKQVGKYRQKAANVGKCRKKAVKSGNYLNGNLQKEFTKTQKQGIIVYNVIQLLKEIKMTLLLSGTRIALIMLFLGFFHTTIRYDLLLMSFIFGLSIFAFYKECLIQHQLTRWSILFIITTFIYNPFFKIPFDRDLWLLTYGITFLLLALYLSHKKITKIQNLKKIINEIQRQNKEMEKAINSRTDINSNQSA